VGFAKLAANWLLNRFSKRCFDAGLTPEASRITPENFAEFLKLIEQGSIKGAASQEVFDLMFESGQDPSDIVESKGLGVVSDEAELLEVVTTVIDANPNEAENYRQGKIALLKFFVGKVMKATGGRADAQIAERLLVERLGETPK
jgi:aspartyl-tRNA(Asn)/glutamyl-tRNA(Gln) amidotransferase subunit B